MDSTNRRIRLGEEDDERLRQALMTVLKDLGATVDDKTWGVAGSQELERLSVRIDQQSLVVEAETYIGLSVTGEEKLVDEVVRRVNVAMTRRFRA